MCLGGLISGYGSDSDSENDDSRQGSDDLLKNETYDSDEELRKRIREKRRNFAITEKEITANHETAVDSGKASIIEGIKILAIKSILNSFILQFKTLSQRIRLQIKISFVQHLQILAMSLDLDRDL